jgi:DNA-binding winged helix-turn-helix (wHTH) protein
MTRGAKVLRWSISDDTDSRTEQILSLIEEGFMVSEPRRFPVVFGPFCLDLPNARLWHGSQLVALRPKAMDLLAYLAERPQQLISKHELLNALWSNAHVHEGVLKTQVKELRRALGDAARRPRFIETVHRRGYRFSASVQPLDEVETRRLPWAHHLSIEGWTASVRA